MALTLSERRRATRRKMLHGALQQALQHAQLKGQRPAAAHHVVQHQLRDRNRVPMLPAAARARAVADPAAPALERPRLCESKPVLPVLHSSVACPSAPQVPWRFLSLLPCSLALSYVVIYSRP